MAQSALVPLPVPAAPLAAAGSAVTARCSVSLSARARDVVAIVRAWAAVSASADERMGDSAAESIGQERRGAAAGARSEDCGARAARTPSLGAPPQGDVDGAPRRLHPVSLSGPRLRRGPLAAPGRVGHDLVPAQLSAVLRAAGPGSGAPVSRGWRRVGLWHV